MEPIVREVQPGWELRIYSICTARYFGDEVAEGGSDRQVIWEFDYLPVGKPRSRAVRDRKHPSEHFLSWYADDDCGTEYFDRGGASARTEDGGMLYADNRAWPAPRPHTRWFELLYFTPDGTEGTVRVDMPLEDCGPPRSRQHVEAFIAEQKRLKPFRGEGRMPVNESHPESGEGSHEL